MTFRILFSDIKALESCLQRHTENNKRRSKRMKTLLILVDGMRPDALANCKAAQKVMANSVYTLNAKTVMPSVTLPCHVSLFFSMMPEHHGTQSNTYTPPKRPILSLFW